MFKVKEGLLIGNKQVTGEGMTEVLTALDVGDMAFQDSAGVNVGTLLADVLSTNAVNTFNKPQIAGMLAIASNTAWDGNDKQHLTVTVNGSSFIIANPSFHTNGAYYSLFISYTTSHTVSFGTSFKGITDVVPTATAGAADHLVFRSDGTNLHLVGSAYNIKA